jgi:5-deoxy-glucuronate isomerase
VTATQSAGGSTAVGHDRYLPAGATRSGHYSVDVSPPTAGWTYASLRVLDLEPGKPVEVPTADCEVLVLPLAGGCSVRCGGFEVSLIGRPSVFDRVTDFAYLPFDAKAVIESRDGARVALPGARAARPLPPRYGRADEVPVEIRGAGCCSRQVNNFASPDAFETDRLIAVEVLTPGGNWSSYPPHKHDENRPGEAVLEEIYYFEVAGTVGSGHAGPGGYQRVYTSGPGKEIDVLAEVSSGDVVLVPHGYHGPSMAAPGYDLYYLNVLAGEGPVRTMAFCDDPEHAWIRGSWSQMAVDPRLPMTSHRGRGCG